MSIRKEDIEFWEQAALTALELGSLPVESARKADILLEIKLKLEERVKPKRKETPETHCTGNRITPPTPMEEVREFPPEIILKYAMIGVRTFELFSRGGILTIGGPQGCGKTLLKDEIRKHFPTGWDKNVMTIPD